MTLLVAAAPAEPSSLILERIQLVVDRWRDELGITERVSVSIKPQVALIVSVEAPEEHGQPFRLAIEDRFLARLSSEELDAAVAHELGHVWVFTPLAGMYHKLWAHGGTRGDLNAFLGP